MIQLNVNLQDVAFNLQDVAFSFADIFLPLSSQNLFVTTFSIILGCDRQILEGG